MHSTHNILDKLAAPAHALFKETSKHSIFHQAQKHVAPIGSYMYFRADVSKTFGSLSALRLIILSAACCIVACWHFSPATFTFSLLFFIQANMAPLSQATTALLVALAPPVSAFAPAKTPNSANVAASSPPRAVSIPVEPATAPWDRITGGSSKEGTATTTGDDRDEWIRNLDYDAFAKDVTALGKELQKSSGPADVEHLQKVS